MIDQHLPAPAQRDIQALIEEHVGVSCELVALDEQHWAIVGQIAVDGEVLVAKFDSRWDAQTALDELEAAGLTPPRTRKD
jgi:hypothetical protein